MKIDLGNILPIILGVIVFAVMLKLLSIIVVKIKYLRSPLLRIDQMDGIEFERYLGKHFSNMGYEVDYTPDSRDFGADLIITDGEETIVVQAKRYSDKVGTKAVQEIVAAKNYYGADRCMVVTNNYFTEPAEELAAANAVKLWDRDDIDDYFIRNGAKITSLEFDEEPERLSMHAIKEQEYEDGYADGIDAGVRGAIRALRSHKCPDQIIVEDLIEAYGITRETAEEYVMST